MGGGGGGGGGTNLFKCDSRCTDVFCVNYCLIVSPHKAAYMLENTIHMLEKLLQGLRAYNAISGVRHSFNTVWLSL